MSDPSCVFNVNPVQTAALQYFWAQRDHCVGIAGYVNGSDCAAWPTAAGGGAAPASLVFQPAAVGGNPVTAPCDPPIFAPGWPAAPITTLGCDLTATIFSEAGAFTYHFPTDTTGGTNTLVVSVGTAPPVAQISTVDGGTLTLTEYSLVTGTTVVSTFEEITTVESSTTIVTTVPSTYTTSTTFTTTTFGTATVVVPARQLFHKRQAPAACTVDVYIGSYAADALPAAQTGTVTTYAAGDPTTTTVLYTPSASTTKHITDTKWINSTTTEIWSVIANATSVVTIQATVLTTSTSTTSTSSPPTTSSSTSSTSTTSSSSTTSSRVPQTTAGPFVIEATPTSFDNSGRRKLARKSLEKRQTLGSLSGYIGVVDGDNTVGLVQSIDQALIFYTVNGRLQTISGGRTWYTYTDPSIVASPGYEPWILQDTPPPAGSISTEFSGVDFGILDWLNDQFPVDATALPCQVDEGGISTVEWLYDLSADVACNVLEFNANIVDPGPESTTTLTSQTTVTTISTITGEPITSFVCGGNTCANPCSSLDTANFITTEVCSTAPNGLSTCQACISSTLAPIVETAVDWVTSTIPCATPPCVQTLYPQPPAPAPPAPAPNTPCNGDQTVTVTQGGATVTQGGGSAAPTDAAPPASSDTPTTTRSSSTRTGTPTASPSVGMARKLFEVQSGSITALVLVAGAFVAFA